MNVLWAKLAMHANSVVHRYAYVHACMYIDCSAMYIHKLGDNEFSRQHAPSHDRWLVHVHVCKCACACVLVGACAAVLHLSINYTLRFSLHMRHG